MKAKTDVFIYSAAIFSCFMMILLLTTSTHISYNLPNEDPYNLNGSSQIIDSEDKLMLTENLVKPGNEEKETSVPVIRTRKITGQADSRIPETSTQSDEENEIDRIILEILTRNGREGTGHEPEVSDKEDRVVTVFGDTQPEKTVEPEKTLEQPVKPAVESMIYTVEKGDCLSEIAHDHSVTLDQLLSWNRINDPNRIYIGQKLTIKKTTEQVSSDILYAAEQGQAEASVKDKKTEIYSTPESPSVSATDKSKPIARTAFIWPTKSKRITSDYGMRKNPWDPKKIEFHSALDIGGTYGDPIYAAKDGKVAYSGWKGGYGKIVIIRHDGGYMTVYAHNKSNLVTTGQTVKQGQVIARIGSTGRSTGNHVHFEIRYYSKPVNPISFLSHDLAKNN